MQGIERKPEPRSCSGKEHQCVVGLSLPSYFDCRKRVNYAQVSAARDHLQGGLSLVSAASRLVSMPGACDHWLDPELNERRDESRRQTRATDDPWRERLWGQKPGTLDRSVRLELDTAS